MTYEISIEANCKSKAKLLFHGKMPDRYIEGKNYDINSLKLKNEGEKDFPGGVAKIWIVYTTNQIHLIHVPIKEKIKSKDEIVVPVEDNYKSKSAMARGYALFFGKIIANDSEPVKLITYGQKPPDNINPPSFQAIYIESKTDIYTYDALRISAIGLFITALSFLIFAFSSALRVLSENI